MNYRILYYRQLSSTNDLARELAKQSAAAGTVVLSDYQTQGRGRFKRRWHSPRGKDLLFSILIRPPVKNHRASIFTQIAARSVSQTLGVLYGIDARLKRPNDVLVGGRKICGILTEGSAFPARLEYLIIGIGINVNSRRKQLIHGATSVCEVTGVEQDREALLEAVLAEFHKCTAEFSVGRLIPEAVVKS